MLCSPPKLLINGDMYRRGESVMTLSNWFGRLSCATALALGLAGCVDATIEIAVTGPETARATMTQIMSADIYSMIQMGDEDSGSGFCEDGTLTENADGSATCVVVEEGPFANITLGSDEGGVVFTAVGPGLVRVSMPTEEMKEEAGADDTMDEETRQMVEAFFTGHTVTISFSGQEIVETNLTVSADRRTATQVIPLIDLVNGVPDLPDELFAVVRVP